jgi:hypothetical protein
MNKCLSLLKTLSKTGLIFSGVYFLLTMILLLMAQGNIDSKSHFLLLQLPLALQLALIDELGGRSFIQGMSWFKGYLCIGLPTLVILYFIGAGLAKFMTRLWAHLSDPKNMVDPQ